jgi:hypothetical protein
MALSHDLLAQARILATVDITKPKQANLRRAVSAAYYALFHLLLAACVRRIGPSSPATLAPRIARSLTHSEMRDVCLPISKSNPGGILKSRLPSGFSAEMERFAQAFVDLQQERHRADYDLTAIFTRTETIGLLERTQTALSALIFAKRWSK